MFGEKVNKHGKINIRRGEDRIANRLADFVKGCNHSQFHSPKNCFDLFE